MAKSAQSWASFEDNVGFAGGRGMATNVSPRHCTIFFQNETLVFIKQLFTPQE